jgi:hypothetical protein
MKRISSSAPSVFGIRRPEYVISSTLHIPHLLTLVQSLPAIRFQASRTKMRYWAIWRAAMPQALLAKRARETHNDAVLSEI